VRLKVRNHNVHGALRRGVGIPQHLKRLSHSRGVAHVDPDVTWGCPHLAALS
jgi:hypothetical protein